LPLIELTEDVELDVTVDGADEVAPNLDLLKGRGGALVRERIVAAASRRQVIVVGPRSWSARSRDGTDPGRDRAAGAGSLHASLQAARRASDAAPRRRMAGLSSATTAT
jgi:ribose 5-phosphate isomerase A